MPKIEVVGRSKQKVEQLFWDTITQVRADLAGSSGEMTIRHFVRRMERNGHDGSTLPPWCVMMRAWIDTPWNGSATTS